MLTKGTPGLYQNRYCDQENFNLVISAGHHNKGHYSRNISKVKYPSFSNVEILVANSKCSDIVLTSCSSVWILCSRGWEHFKNSRGDCGNWKNIVQMPDLRRD